MNSSSTWNLYKHNDNGKVLRVSFARHKTHFTVKTFKENYIHIVEKIQKVNPAHASALWAKYLSEGYQEQI